MLTLTRGDWRVPGVVTVGGLLAHSCALPNQLVPPVAGPAHHAVKMTPGLAHYKAVLWGVWGTAVHRYNSWRNKGTRERRGGEWQGKGEGRETRDKVRMKSRKGNRKQQILTGKREIKQRKG